jgi:hypothetical protein
VKRLLLWVSLALALWATSLQAQVYVPITPATLGLTWCEVGRPRTFIDAAVVGSDSLEELMVHERTHREQQIKRTGATGQCIPFATPEEFLAAEVEAYCAGRVERLKRFPADEVDDSYLRRLLSQFWETLPVTTIVNTYLKDCVHKPS